MARRLGERLVLEGVVTPEMVARALERQKETGQKLGECLVRLGLDETPVLRLLAQELQTRFVSTVKLAQARIEPALLERVPVRLAEGFDFIPLRLDEPGPVLSIAIAEPQRHRALEEIARAVSAARVQPFVAVRRSIRAAIRKHYYSDPHAFEHMSDEDACPHCGAPSAPGAFQCPRCELLLVRHLEDLPPRDNVSLVRALLSSPDRTLAREVPSPPHLDKTRACAYVPDSPGAMLVPTIIAGLDLAERPLNPFEAYILSFVDGRTSVVDLARITRLTEVELRAIFESLSERGVIQVKSAEVKRAKAAPEARSAPPAAVERRAPAPTASPAPTPAASPVPPPREPPRPPVPERAAAPELAAVKEKSPAPGAGQPGVRSEPPAESILQRAVQLERDGRFQEAIELLERGISRLRNPAPLYNRLGMILLNQQRDYAAALALFQKAADLEPDNSIYTMNLYAVLGLQAEATNPGKKARR
jgi:type IV pilus assembly protein PilB